MTRGGLNYGTADSGGGYYQRLARGFLSGHLHAIPGPPSELVAITNQTGFPTDPELTAPYRSYGIHDGIVWDGDLYYYWGPGPVVSTVIPARLIGVHLSETDVGTLSFVSFPFVSAWLVMVLRRRFRTSTSRSLLILATTSLFYGATISATRIAIWEANVFFCAILSYAFLVLVIGELLKVPNRRWSSGRLASMAVLLLVAVLTRFESSILILIPIVCELVERSSYGWSDIKDVLRRQWPLITSAATGISLLLLYNWARFGSPLEFGLKNQVGGDDHREIIYSSFSYVIPNLYQYLLRPIAFNGEFPFIDLSRFDWPFRVVGTYLVREPVNGLLFTTPAVLAFFLPRKRSDGSSIRAILIALSISLAVQLVFLGYAIFGAVQRYRLLPDVVVAILIALWMAAPPRRRSLVSIETILVSVSLFLALLVPLHGNGETSVPNSTYERTMRRILAVVGLPTRNDVEQPFVISSQGCDYILHDDKKTIRVAPLKSSVPEIQLTIDLHLTSRRIDKAIPLFTVGKKGRADIIGFSWNGLNAQILHDKWFSPAELSRPIRIEPGLHHIEIRAAWSHISVFLNGVRVLHTTNTHGVTTPYSVGENSLGATTVAITSSIEMNWKTSQPVDCN